MTKGNTSGIIGITMKERDTIILAVRIKKTLMDEVDQKVSNKKISRNSWMIRAIKEGLRPHTRKDKTSNG